MPILNLLCGRLTKLNGKQFVLISAVYFFLWSFQQICIIYIIGTVNCVHFVPKNTRKCIAGGRTIL